MPQLLSWCSRAWELQLLSPHAKTTEAHVPWSPRSATRKASTARACTLQLQSSPHSPQLEKSPPSNKDPAQPKINKQIQLCIYKIREIIAYVYARGHGSIKKKWCWKNRTATCKKIKLEHFLTPYNKKASKWSILFWKFFRLLCSYFT